MAFSIPDSSHDADQNASMRLAHRSRYYVAKYAHDDVEEITAIRLSVDPGQGSALACLAE